MSLVSRINTLATRIAAAIKDITPVSYFAGTMTVNTGTLNSGAVSGLQAIGGTDVAIQEVIGVNPLTVTFDFAGVTKLAEFVFNGYYAGGSGHQLSVEIYNHNTTNWDVLGMLGTETVKTWHSYGIFNPNAYINAGAVSVRFRHIQTGNASHILYLDYLELNYGGAGGSTNVTASSVSYTPYGNIAATNVASAINELDTEKQPLLVSGTNIKTINGTSLLGSGDITITGGGSGEIWTALTASYASASTFTFTGTDKDAKLIQLSLLTLTDSAGTTRRIGYVKSAVNNSGIITATVVTNTDLQANDKDWKVAYNRKVEDYLHLISTPGECILDTSYSQGVWRQKYLVDWYLLPCDFTVEVAATGASAALTINVYKNTTALFSTAPDMVTATSLIAQRPTTNSGSAGETISLRLPNSAGTTKAADFQAKLFIIPQAIFQAF